VFLHPVPLRHLPQQPERSARGFPLWAFLHHKGVRTVWPTADVRHTTAHYFIGNVRYRGFGPRQRLGFTRFFDGHLLVR
jgi:hypothetical protein